MEAYDRSRQRWQDCQSDAHLTWGREIDGRGAVEALRRHEILRATEEHGTARKQKNLFRVLPCDSVATDLTRVLEIGPGYGRLYRAVRDAGLAVAWTGVDLNAASIERLRRELPEAAWLLGDGDADLPGGPYELVVSTLTFKHLFPDFARAARQARAVLAEGGALAFDLLESDAPENAEWEAESGCWTRRYTRAEVSEILAEAGYRSIEFGHLDHAPDRRRLFVVARAEAPGVRRQASAEPLTSKPIFILAWGGRTGSTWLQRLLTSTGDVLVWGEWGLLGPFEQARENKWGLPALARRGPADLLTFRRRGLEADICQLLPERPDFERCWARMADDLFGGAAAREGYPRWGKKEILWGTQHVEWILSQWPEARIIYLYRDFADVYRSHVGRNCHHGIEHDVLQKWLKHGRQSLDRLSLGEPRERLLRYDQIASAADSLLEWCGLGPRRCELSRISSTAADLPPEQAEYCAAQQPIVAALEAAAKARS